MSDHKGGNEEIIFTGKPSCCGAPGHWCKNYKWLITTTYIEREHGICCTAIDNLQLIRIKDIEYAQCCCTCCGVITITSSDTSTPTLKIAGIPNGKEVFARLRDAYSALHNNAKIEIDV